MIQHLVEDVPEDSWEDVEALGWAYQFYNSERKDEFFKSKRKAAAEDIAPATQLFTPDWIVRYMVQNSLGRLWMLNNPESPLRDKMEFYIEPDAEHEDFLRVSGPSLGRLWMLNNPESPLRDKMEFYIEPDAEHEDFLRVSGPEEITFCDPACGSGHILVYAFRLLTEMYRERGWRDRDIARSILESNLSGYEIDPRAAQIAQTALCMEALSLDRRWLSRGVSADVRVLQNIEIDQDALDPASVLREKPQLLDALEHLGEIGSLFEPSPDDIGALKAELMHVLSGDLFVAKAQDGIKDAHKACEALSRRFDVVVANPPYMKSKGINTWFSAWLKIHYPHSSHDLCTSFIDRAYTLTQSQGYQALVTMQSWLAAASFREMRKALFVKRRILSLLHIGPKAFDSIGGDVVNTAAFTIHNDSSIDDTVCFNLVDLQTASQKENAYIESLGGTYNGRRFKTNLNLIVNDMGFPLTAYKLPDKMLHSLVAMQRISDCASGSVGIQTGNNERFIRNWWEPSISSFNPNCASIEEAAVSPIKFFPLNKGGDYRKWYGNDLEIINWYKDGAEVKTLTPGETRHVQDYRNELKFQPLVTWSKIGGGAFRIKPAGFLSDMAGVGIYPDEDLSFFAAFLNSSVARLLLDVISPSITKSVGEVRSLPVPQRTTNTDIEQYVHACMSLSKADWDSQETSWDFKCNPLI